MRTMIVGAVPVLSAAALVAAIPLAGQEGSPQDLDAFRAEEALLARDGGWWQASNADYMEADGENAPEAFGIRRWVRAGGLSGSGCLWSIEDGEPVAVHWWLHAAWDVAEGRAVYYQAHTSGRGSGLGYGKAVADDVGTIEQVFAWVGADGTDRVRHEERWLDDDTRVTRSFNLVDGEWKAGRRYVWERRTAGPTPFGPDR